MNQKAIFLFTLIQFFPLVGQAQDYIWQLRYSGNVGTVGINPLNPNTVLAEDLNGTLVVSYDKGGTWTKLGFLSPTIGGLLLIHPIDTLVIFSAFPSVLRSSDYGLTWSNVLTDASYIIPLVIDPIQPDNLYAGAIDGDIYRSTDRGITWEYISNAGPDLCSLAIRPDSTNILYAGWAGNISKSMDGGFSWRVTTTTGSDDNAFILVDFHRPSVAYTTAHKEYYGVWKTTDGGEQWAPTSPTDFSDWYMDIDRSSPAIVYVAGRGEIGHAVLRSTNEGASWDTLSQGLPSSWYINSLKAHPLSGDVWVAGGVGVYLWAPVVSSVDGIAELPTSYRLEQNYPNPFNPSTTISFSVPRSSRVTLKIFNLLGEEVATVVSGPMDAGIHTVQWGATGQPSGVYFYRLQAGDFTETKKLLLLK